MTEPELLPVLDLWVGTGEATAAWRERGHPIISVDINPATNATLCRDIELVTVEDLARLAPHGFAFAWASPDCAVWSLANLHSNHWEDCTIPLTDTARDMRRKVIHTLYLLENIQTPHWVLENPWGLLRMQEFMLRYQSCEVTYCQYGEDRMKRTNLWGVFPSSFTPRRCDYGDPCHPRCPRGSNAGTQALTREERIQVPRALSWALYDAVIKSNGRCWPTLDDYFSL